MSIKEIIRIVVILGLFFVGLPYLIKLFSTPAIDVEYGTSVNGEVTGSKMNRQYYLHYLNGNEKTYYDFNRFMPADALPPGLSQEEINRRALGTYLRKGDYIEKGNNTNTLSVRRAGQRSLWVCAVDSVAR